MKPHRHIGHNREETHRAYVSTYVSMFLCGKNICMVESHG